jgi:hypothetical protein
MNQLIIESLFNNSPCGFALLKITFDKAGIPQDSIFIETNQLFLKITHNSHNDINNLIQISRSDHKKIYHFNINNRQSGLNELRRIGIKI